MENQFIVDLGPIKLTDQQRASINSAIQKAVAGELTNMGGAERYALIPANKWKKGIGPLINGIVIRPLNDRVLKDLIQNVGL